MIKKYYDRVKVQFHSTIFPVYASSVEAGVFASLKGMWHVFMGMLLVFVCAGIMAPSISARERQRVRVGYVESTNFSEGASQMAYKSGYAYEYLQKIAYYSGWEYEYVYGGFSQILEKLEKGEIDLMAGISKTEKREKTIIFPDYPMGVESYYIYVHANSDLAQMNEMTLQQLQGKVIGCTRNSMQNYYLDEWNAQNRNMYHVAVYPGNEELYDAFDGGELDAVVDTDIAIIPEDEMRPVVRLGSTDYYLAVSMKRKDLLQELNSIQAKLKSESPYYEENLHGKYMTGTAVSLMLSDEENEWLARHREIRVGYLENYMPFCASDENGYATGLLTDIMSGIQDALSLADQLHIQYVGFRHHDDMTKAVRDGDVDIAFPIQGDIWYSERSGLFQTSDIIHITADLVFKGQFSEKSTRRIGVNANNTLQYEYTCKAYPDAQIVAFDSLRDCLDAIVSGEIDSTIMNGLRTGGILESSAYQDLHDVKLLVAFPLAMGVKSGNTQLLSLLNRGLAALDEDFALKKTYKYQVSLNGFSIEYFMRENMFMIIGLIITLAVMIVFVITILYRRSRKGQKVIREALWQAQEAQVQTQFALEQMEAAQTMTRSALEEASRANAAKSAFLSRMSHDIRTPLNGIIGLLDINEKHADDETLIRENIVKMRVAAKHLQALVNDVLELSKMDDRNVTLAREVFNIKELAGDVLTIVSLRAAESGVKVVYKEEKDAFKYKYVYGSPLHIRQIGLNIMGNSIKYNKTGGTVSVSMSSKLLDDTHVIYKCTVSDTGIGMSKEFLEHIFEPFSQEHDDARSTYQGTGLGMAIVKSLIDKMNGTIEIFSEVNIGSTFVITIPFERAPEQESNKMLTESDVSIAGRKILLAEDNELNMEIVSSILQDAGAQISQAFNGREALNLYQSHPAGTYDIILMDIMMPEMDGLTATKAIRMSSQNDSATIPIIAMTANAFAEDVATCREAGMNDHLAKPLDTPLMLAMIAKYTEHA